MGGLFTSYEQLEAYHESKHCGTVEDPPRCMGEYLKKNECNKTFKEERVMFSGSGKGKGKRG